MSFVLDAGALIAVDRRDRNVGAVLRVVQLSGEPIRTSAAVLAQIWRDAARQVNLSRVLMGVEIRALDSSDARGAGALLRKSGSADIVDAHVAFIAEPGDTVVTGDPEDIQRLLEAHGVKARLLTL